jgi:MTH538 TIR-like domain (DUF1863)
MAKRVFFSFHYQDVLDFRANVVRNHWVTKPDRESAGIFDASIWQSATRMGDASVKNLINGALDGTSVTCILVGSDTHARKWVRYEILKSFRKGNSIVAVHINGIRGRDGSIKPRGANPLIDLGVTFSASGESATLWERVGADWREYSAIGDSASFPCPVGPERRGKGFALANWYREYDWVADNGYDRFANWIG